MFCCACYFGYIHYKKRKNPAAQGMAQQPDPSPGQGMAQQQPGQGRGAFSDGLCDCGNDPSSACKTWCCPCLSVSHITNVAPELGTFNDWLMWCCLCTFIGSGRIGCCIAELAYRQRARQLYGIPEGECPDICAVCCCQCCALSQLHRHVDRYPPRNLQKVVVASPSRTAAYAETPAEDLSYAQTNDEYLSVSAGLGDSSAGKAKESFSGFDNGSSDDEI